MRTSHSGEGRNCDVCRQYQLGLICQASRVEGKEMAYDDGIRDQLGLRHEASREKERRWIAMMAFAISWD
jgi:hypothetical protein